jgi:hypothetical protein
VLPWETWKADALGAISPERVSSWEHAMKSRQAREIAVLCGGAMRHFGYTDGLPSATVTAATWARLGPLAALRVARYARSRRINLRTIEGYTL